MWRGGSHGEAALPAASCRNSLALADRHGLPSLAFPCLGTGVDGHPAAAAARIAVHAVRGALATAAVPPKVAFRCYSPADLALHDALLA